MAKTDKYRQLAQALLGEDADVDEAAKHLYTNEEGTTIYMPPEAQAEAGQEPAGEGLEGGELAAEAGAVDNAPAEIEGEAVAEEATPAPKAEAATPTPQARQIARKIGSQGGRSPKANSKLTPEQIGSLSDEEFDRKLAEMAGVGG